MKKATATSFSLHWASITALSLFVGWPALAHAQSAGELQTATLDDLMKITVTTASRRAEGVGDAPAHVEVITARQIRARGYISLGDLLRDQLGIKMELGTDPDYPSDITVQGSRNTSRVVLLMDGIRVSSPTREPLPIMANYPVHNARQVEIVFGPASALYGADAFSAVVNVITKDAGEAPDASLTASVGQDGMSNYVASYGHRLGDRGSLVISGQWFRDVQADLSQSYPALFDGMQAQRTGVFNTIFGPMSSAVPVAAGFENPVAAHNLHVSLGLGGFQFTLFQSRERASTSLPYTPDNAAYDGRAFGQNDLMVAAGAYTRRFGAVTSDSTITVSSHRLSPQSGYWNVFSNFRKSFKYAYGSMGSIEQQLSWQPRKTMAVTAGGTFEQFYAIPQGADLNAPIESRDRPGTILDTTIVDTFNTMRYSNTGAFVQMQYSPKPSVSLTAGTRADYSSRYGGTVNPRIGAVIKPAAGTMVKLLFGTAFLAPSPYQATSHYGSFYSTDGGRTYASDYWHVGNQNLKPQEKSSLEASVTQSIGRLVSVSASGFFSFMDDIIQHSDPNLAGPGVYLGWPVAYIDSPVNSGQERIYGGLLDATFLKSWSSDTRLQARAGISVVDGSSDEGSRANATPLGSIAPFQFRAGADLDLGQWTASTSVMAFGNQRLNVMNPDGATRATIPGYGVVDVNVRRNHLTRNIDAFLRVENLFDARYLNVNQRAVTNPEELTGWPQPPRRISAGVSVRMGR